MSSKSLRWDQRNGSNEIKTVVDDDGTVRNIAITSKKLTTSMKVGLTSSGHMPSDKRLEPLVKKKQKVHTRVPKKGQGDKQRKLPRRSAIKAQAVREVEHMHHEEFKAQQYEHPTPNYDVPFQKFKAWYTGKDDVQRYELYKKPKLGYRKRDAVTIDRVNSGERPSMNLEVGMNYLKTDPRTGKRIAVNQKVAVVTRQEKQAQRLAHAASKKVRREKKRGRVERQLARTSAG